MRWFASAFCAGVVLSLGAGACMSPATCGGEARQGRYSIGRPVNFEEVPVALTDGVLEVDLARGVARILYPDGVSAVDLRVVFGGEGGAGGAR